MAKTMANRNRLEHYMLELLNADRCGYLSSLSILRKHEKASAVARVYSIDMLTRTSLGTCRQKAAIWRKGWPEPTSSALQQGRTLAGCRIGISQFSNWSARYRRA